MHVTNDKATRCKICIHVDCKQINPFCTVLVSGSYSEGSSKGGGKDAHLEPARMQLKNDERQVSPNSTKHIIDQVKS